jgi:ketosteroid isomerase-like protein
MLPRISVSWLPLVVFVAACGGQSQSQAPSGGFDADAQIAAWVDLWNTRDLSKVDELFLADSRVTYFSSEREGLIQGAAAVREHHEGFGFVEGGIEPEQELWVEDIQSSVYGTVAVVTAVWSFGDRSAPRDSISRGPMTVVYTLVDDRYRIAHIHFANY